MVTLTITKRPVTVATSGGRTIPQGGDIPPEERVTAAGVGKSIASTARSIPESMVGIGGDIPAMAGGAAGWVSRKIGLGDPERVGAAVERGVQGVTSPATKIIRALQIAGIIDDQTAEKIIAGQIPTSADVASVTDRAVSTLPESMGGPVGVRPAHHPEPGLIQEITRHQPQNPTEQLASTVTAFAPMFFMPTTAETALGNIGARTARTVIPAIGTEAAGQTAHELAPEYEEAARLVAGLIAGGGVAGTERSFTTRSALRKVQSNPAAAGELRRLLRNQGMTDQEAISAMKEISPVAAPLDIGSATAQKAAQIHSTPGPGRDTIDRFLREREAGQGERVQAAVTGAVGPELQRSDIIQALKDRAAALSPEYEAAHAAQTQPTGTQSILDDLETDLQSVKGREATRALMDVRRMLFKGNEPDLSTRGLHEARKAIDSQLYNQDGTPKPIGKDTANKLNEYRAKIDAALAEAGPIKEVDVKRAQIGKEERAFGTGQEIYKTEPGTPSAIEFERTWNDMSEGERARALEGVNVETWRRIGVTANDLSEVKKLMKGEGKWPQEKLATVIGKEKTDALTKVMTGERTMQERYRRIVQNSATAEKLTRAPGGIVQGAVEAIPDVLAAGTIGGWRGATGAALANARQIGLNLVGRAGSRDAAVAKLLTSTRPDDIARALQIMRERGSIMPPAVITALLARRQEMEDRKNR
jgi:hypothetical protein